MFKSLILQPEWSSFNTISYIYEIYIYILFFLWAGELKSNCADSSLFPKAEMPTNFFLLPSQHLCIGVSWKCCNKDCWRSRREYFWDEAAPHPGAESLHVFGLGTCFLIHGVVRETLLSTGTGNNELCSTRLKQNPASFIGGEGELLQENVQKKNNNTSISTQSCGGLTLQGS